MDSLPMTNREKFVRAQLSLIKLQYNAIVCEDVKLALKLGNDFGAMLPTLHKVVQETRDGVLESGEREIILEIIQQIRTIQKQSTLVLNSKKTELACKLHKLREGKAAVEAFSSGRQHRKIFELSA